VVSKLVLNEDIQSDEFLSAYKRFWERYWCELPTCESAEIEIAMVNLKQKVYDKNHLNPDDQEKISNTKEEMNMLLPGLAKAVRNFSLPLEYSEPIRDKIRASK